MSIINKIIFSVLLFSAGVLQAQSLEDFLKLAVENNLELKALEYKYEAILQNAEQQMQLNNPEIGIGAPVVGPQTRLGAQVLMVQASQMFPWFGTLKSKKNVVLQMSKSEYENISALKLELFYKIKLSYYTIHFLNQNKNIISNIINTYKSLENIAITKVKNGEASGADALRISLKLQELNQELMLLENDIKRSEIEINTIIKQDINTPILVEDSFPINETLLLNTDEFENKIIENHPIILKLKNEMDVSIQEQNLNKKMNSPNFGFGLDYALINKSADVLSARLSFTLPVYRKAYKAKNAEENLKQQSIDLLQEQTIDNIVNMIAQYKLDYNNAKLKKQLAIEQTETINIIYELLLSEYSAKGTGFDEILQIQNQRNSLKIGIAQSEFEQNVSLAKIEKYLNF